MNGDPPVTAFQVEVSSSQDFYLYEAIRNSILLYFLFTQIAPSTCFSSKSEINEASPDPTETMS